MELTPAPQGLSLRLDEAEARLLASILARILKHYRAAPEDLNPRVRGVWYSSRGCETARMTPEEIRDWMEALHGFKGAHTRLIEAWIRQMRLSAPGGAGLQLSAGEAPAFLTVLNDHRLMAAALRNIGEAEMTLLPQQAIVQLAPPRARALLEIQFLGAIIESILDQMPGQPGRWNKPSV